MEDLFLLQRFVKAQNSIYNNVVEELKRGKKITCWMWFVFPQVFGLGRTSTNQEYSIKSLEEAKAYIIHPVLGTRLQECTKLVLNIGGRTVDQIFGFPDNLKFRSSMTLFKNITKDNKLFHMAIAKFFNGKEDDLTINILKTWKK